MQIIATNKQRLTQDKIENDVATGVWYGFPGVDDLLLELVQESIVLLGIDLLVLLVLCVLLVGLVVFRRLLVLGHLGCVFMGSYV